MNTSGDLKLNYRVKFITRPFREHFNIWNLPYDINVELCVEDRTMEFDGNGGVSFISDKISRFTPRESRSVLYCDDYKLRNNIQEILTRSARYPYIILRLKYPDIKIVMGVNRSTPGDADVASFLYVFDLMRNDPMFNSLMDPTIKHLDLHACNISWLDQKLQRLRQLTVLDLSGNNLQKLPTGFGDLPKLEKLSLAGNKLGSTTDPKSWVWLLSPSIQKNLTWLDLSDNSLSELPEEMRFLTKLEELHVGSNMVKNLSASLGNFGEDLQHSLTSLNLGYMNIEIVPNELRKFGKLQKLSISGNRLETLPNWIARTSIKYLDVSKNRLRYIPDYLMEERWIHVNVSGNDFSAGIEYFSEKNGFPTLIEVAARKVLNHRLTLAPDSLPRHLMQHLDHFWVCICGKAFLQPTVTAMIRVHRSEQNLDRICTSARYIPILFRFCSDQCRGGLKSFDDEDDSSDYEDISSDDDDEEEYEEVLAQLRGALERLRAL